MGFTLTYELCGAGWADVRIQDGAEQIDVTVSYLHDSLRELAMAARALCYGATQTRVVFMNEPGEIQLHLLRSDETVDFEARWYGDWNSWGMHPDDKYKLLLRGTTTVKRFVGEVYSVLCSLSKEYGLDEYKEKWIEHDFPSDLLNELTKMRQNK